MRVEEQVERVRRRLLGQPADPAEALRQAFASVGVTAQEAADAFSFTFTQAGMRASVAAANLKVAFAEVAKQFACGYEVQYDSSDKQYMLVLKECSDPTRRRGQRP